MDLRQLRYFVAVVDEGGIRKASRQLYLSQPSISQALRQLEGELCVELIRRTPAGIEVTAAGTEFVEYARDILDRAARAQAAMRRKVEEQSCTLRVGLLSGVIAAGELTAPMIEHFQQLRPDVNVQLVDISFEDQAMPLRSDVVDVALVRGPLRHSELDVMPLVFDQRILLVGATHELAYEEQVAADDILDQLMIPVIAPDYFAAFWHLDDVRGGPNVDKTMPPARTVPELQLAVATGRVIMSAVSTIARILPNALVRTVAVTNVEPCVIAVARRRDDTRRVVRDFVEAAGEAAAAKLELLPGAKLTA
jgi:DNA-binding transcriptional LysR family regulator